MGWALPLAEVADGRWWHGAHGERQSMSGDVLVVLRFGRRGVGEMQRLGWEKGGGLEEASRREKERSRKRGDGDGGHAAPIRRFALRGAAVRAGPGAGDAGNEESPSRADRGRRRWGPAFGCLCSATVGIATCFHYC
jgi:hypothetical protein